MSSELPEWLKRSGAAKRALNAPPPQAPKNEAPQKPALDITAESKKFIQQWNLLEVDGALEGVRMLLGGTEISDFVAQTQGNKVAGVAKTIKRTSFTTSSEHDDYFPGSYNTTSDSKTDPIFTFSLRQNNEVVVNGYENSSYRMVESLGKIKSPGQLKSKLDEYLEKLVKNPVPPPETHINGRQ